MSDKRLFRGFLASDAVLTTAVILAGILRASDAGEGGNPDSLIHLLGEITVLVVWIVALAGLWQFRSWARVVYVGVAAVGLLGSLLLGGAERSGLEAALNALCWLVAGAIIALAYWSPIGAMFRRSEQAV